MIQMGGLYYIFTKKWKLDKLHNNWSANNENTFKVVKVGTLHTVYINFDGFSTKSDCSNLLKQN
jgi:hypothetical protein